MSPDALDHECRVFTAYLIGEEPTPYIRQKYRQAHSVSHALAGRSTTLFDAVSLELVRSFPWALALVDSYSSLIRKRALVRTKLILLLSLLEVSAPSYQHFDSAELGGRARLGSLLACRGLLSMTTFLLAVVLLGPLDGLCIAASTSHGTRDARRRRCVPRTGPPLSAAAVGRDGVPSEPAGIGYDTGWYR